MLYMDLKESMVLLNGLNSRRFFCIVGMHCKYSVKGGGLLGCAYLMVLLFMLFLNLCRYMEVSPKLHLF